MSRHGRRTIILLLTLVVLLLANLLGQRHKFRVDLTADRAYTLDHATLGLLQGLPEAVTVTAYFTGELPPELAVVRQDFKDLLTEYAERSDGKLVFEFKDPGASEEVAAAAVQGGIRPLLIQTRKKDRSENIQVLMGALLRMGNRQAVIPALQEGPGMEWILSSAIAQVAHMEKPLIGVVQGHQEPPVRAVDELAILLQAQYDVEASAIYDAFPINERFSALLIIDPKDSIPAAHLRRLDEYMAKGHGVVLAYGAVESGLPRSPEVRMRDTGLAPWLASHGVQIGPGVVVDERCGQVSVMQSAVQRPVSIPFPFYPLMEHFGDHPVAHGLDMVMFQFASPIRFTGDSSRVRFAPILTTGPKSGVLPAPFQVDLRLTLGEESFRDGPQVLGAALDPVDSTQGRFVVFSNGNFSVGDQGGQQISLPQGNLDLMVNATDWVMRNTDLLSIRGKQRVFRPIRDPGDTVRALLKWVNLLLPVALVLLYGLGRAQWRRRQRKQRMQPGHVR